MQLALLQACHKVPTASLPQGSNRPYSRSGHPESKARLLTQTNQNYNMADSLRRSLCVNDSRRINDFSLHSTTRRFLLNKHFVNKDKRRITFFLDKYLVKVKVYTLPKSSLLFVCYRSTYSRSSKY